MAEKFQKTTFPGIRFREHLTRKNGVRKDQYFIMSYRANGKRKDEALGWASQGWTAKKANTILSELRENQRTGNGPQTLSEMRSIETDRREVEQAAIEEQKKTDLTFDDFFNGQYLPSAITHKKLFTVENETGLYRKWIKPELGHLPFSKIKAFNLEKIKKSMADEGRAPRSIQYVLALVRQVWNFARMNEVTTDSFPKIKIKKFDNKRLRFFSREEAQALLQELLVRSTQLHDMALLSLHTGARAGEIFSLTWGAVDLSGGVLTIKDSKSGKNRFLYLTNEVRAMIQQRFNNQAPDELVFPDQNGKKIKAVSDTFGRAIEKLGFNAGIDDRRDKATFHTLRHTFASWHVQNGTDLYTVKELLGHSTIALTERYSHLRPEGLKQTTRLFDEMAEPDKVINIGGNGK